MQIDSIATSFATSATSSSLAAGTRVTSNGKDQSAVVEQTSAGYEAYIPAPPGPVVTGSSIEDVEYRLNSTVQFQA